MIGRLRDWLRSRLSVRIYLLSVLQLVVIAGGFVASALLNPRTARQPEYDGRADVLQALETALEDQKGLQPVLEQARESLPGTIAVVDPDGEVLASTVAEDAPPCAAMRGPRVPRWSDKVRVTPGPHEPFPERRARGDRPPRRRRRLRDGPPGDELRDHGPAGDGPRGHGPRGDGPRGHGPPGGGPRGHRPPGNRHRRDLPPAIHLGPRPQPPRLCRRYRLRFPSGDWGYAEMRTSPNLPPPAIGYPVLLFVLLVVGVSSWFVARSLLRPLRKMSDAAALLGDGDLAARTGVTRRDELGEVAHAFDAMATQVGGLLSAQRQLVANVSHELRTPLARIRVALDIANEGKVEAVRASLSDISEDVEELEQLVSDVLTLSRLDIAKQGPSAIPPLRLESLAPDSLVEHAASRFRRAHPERSVEVSLADDLPALSGDPVLLRRAIANLLENAHKYTPDPDRPITLKATVDDDLVIDVVDRGIGIAPKDLADAFRPFYRADHSRTRETGGFGLGLALVRRIVEAHEGRVTLTSTVGEGTCATIRLPLSAA